MIKESFKIIRKNKRLVVLLLLSQILFFSVFFLIQSHYQLKILEETKEVMDYLDQFEGEDLLLGDDPLMISRHYKSTMHNMRLLVLFTFLSLIILNNLNWALTNKIINKKTNFLKYTLKFALVYSIFLVLLMGVFYFAVSSSIKIAMFTGGSSPLLNIFSVIGLFLLIYFMFVSLALVNQKNMVKKLFKVGIFKVHYVLLVYAINIAVLVFFSFILFALSALHISLVIIGLILFIFSVVWTRIFLVLVLNNKKLYK